jgi:hypothetical protein
MPKRKAKSQLGQFEFTGVATVSVTCYVEAESAEQARAMVDAGDCEWGCDMVDGDVSDIECTNEEEA